MRELLEPIWYTASILRVRNSLIPMRGKKAAPEIISFPATVDTKLTCCLQ